LFLFSKPFIVHNENLPYPIQFPARCFAEGFHNGRYTAEAAIVAKELNTRGIPVELRTLEVPLPST
jgi:hypothetical protein